MAAGRTRRCHHGDVEGATGSDGGQGAAERAGSPDRVVAFTDGVFAIIITILVLEVGVPPDLDGGSLRQAIEDVEPTLVAWVISFLLVGMYWVGHRDLFVHVRAVNRDVVWLNLLYLLPVSLIPFGASVLGEYPDEPLALHVYGAVLLVASVLRVWLYHYLSRRPQLLWESPGPRTRLGLLLAGAPIPVYLLAMVVADLSTVVSKVLLFVLPAAYFLLVTLLRDRPSTSAEADQFS